MSRTDSDPAEAAAGNPCINICRMDLAGKYCQGCGRTALEIGRWDRMTAQERSAVLAEVARRRPALHRPAAAAAPERPQG
ncbi:DUF1289 domain-containing protein [Cupriavidus basilensis]|uniref:DUF1289 domain-containing protein n=1 Tax=Cupriavidus basilensis TaxID=68895 RepID=A0ABT6B0P8_9BURK|nr:DUF1289 domain-containing protein [Cupriavidus basilensis]MDF3838183.1 DUF1289 domain-containing protein [Cupriavidus basilensis]